MEFKKILLGFIIIGLFVSGCATAKKERKEDETGQKTSEIKDSQKDVKHYEELSHTLNMDGRGDYIIDVPSSGARPWSVTYSAPIKEHCFMLYDYYIGFYMEEYGYKIEDFKSADDVVPKMEKQIITMALYNSNETGAGNLIVTKKENKTVNGRDWIRSEAYIEAGEGKGYADDKVHLIIYSMLRDGKPLYIAGVDRTEAQDQIDLVADYTDKSIETFRDIEKE
ncbi:hypothetical protein MKA54_12105 [[Clostridium] innocuum]|nr:hypothetical protein [[Clostridium] innocuum]